MDILIILLGNKIIHLKLIFINYFFFKRQLRTSQSQLNHFFGMFINNGTWNDIQILSPETVQLMQTIPPGLESEGQALVWYYKTQDSRTLLGHSGGDFGVATDMFFDINVIISFLY